MEQNTKKITVIGLGYVGLSVACQAVKKGFEVSGIDINEQKVASINKGISYLADDLINEVVPQKKIKATTDYKVAKDADIIIIAVLTWVDENKKPRYDAIKSSCESLSQNLKPGQLILIESTIGPLVGDEIIIPALEKSGFKSGKDFFVAHCPERINPGDKKWNLDNIPRIIGANTDKEAKLAYDFYSRLIDAEITMIGSLKEAAAAKVVENVFRDANIAIVNEIAKSFEKLGIDITKVIKGASTKPFAFLPHYPSFGVGGYCVPAASYYLLDAINKSGLDHPILNTAKKTNETMPQYSVSLLEDTLKSLGIDLKGSQVALLGLSYKKNLGEIRDSIALKISDLLKEKGAIVKTYDPYIIKDSTAKNVPEALNGSVAVFLATDHDDFKNIYNDLKNSHIKVVLDGKNFLDKESVTSLGISYKGIGR